jgi:hypothetical protein
MLDIGVWNGRCKDLRTTDTQLNFETEKWSKIVRKLIM